MVLTKISNNELVTRLEQLAHSERKITHLVLLHINEMESRRLYAELGYDSMFRYLTQHLKYSEDAAYRRLSAARLLKGSPEISKKIESGQVTLTQLTQIQSALKQSHKAIDSYTSNEVLSEIIQKIENKSSFETKKVLAEEFELPIQEIEKLTPQRNETARLEITLTMEQLKTLETARDLMSHIVPDGNWADLLTLLAEKQIQKTLGKNSIAEKSETADDGAIQINNKSNSKDEIKTHSFLVARNRKHLKITTKRSLLVNADHRCEYQSPTGIKCGSKFQLQIDHIKPVALGGENNPENLRVLCRTHNLQAAKKMGLASFNKAQH